MAELFFMALPILTSLIGKEFINSAIKETATGTYNILYRFIDHPEIDIALHELDTKATLQNVESIMENISVEMMSQPIYLSLNHLHQIMCTIMDDLTKLKQTADSHKKKWFRKFRTAEYKLYLEAVKANNKILEKRLGYLFELLKAKDCFQVKQPSENIKMIENQPIENQINNQINNMITMGDNVDNVNNVDGEFQLVLANY
jgi:hypothetical protein